MHCAPLVRQATISQCWLKERGHRSRRYARSQLAMSLLPPLPASQPATFLAKSTMVHAREQGPAGPAHRPGNVDASAARAGACRVADGVGGPSSPHDVPAYRCRPARVARESSLTARRRADGRNLPHVQPHGPETSLIRPHGTEVVRRVVRERMPAKYHQKPSASPRRRLPTSRPVWRRRILSAPTVRAWAARWGRGRKRSGAARAPELIPEVAE